MGMIILMALLTLGQKHNAALKPFQSGVVLSVGFARRVKLLVDDNARHFIARFFRDTIGLPPKKMPREKPAEKIPDFSPLLRPL